MAKRTRKPKRDPSLPRKEDLENLTASLKDEADQTKKLNHPDLDR